MEPATPAQPRQRRQRRQKGLPRQGRPRPRRFGFCPRISLRTGLQGTLVLCFMLMLTSALGVSCWMFASATREVMDHMAGEHAAQIRRTLVLASRSPAAPHGGGEFSQLGAELLNGHNEAYVRNVELSVVLIGAVAVLVSLPVMYWLVGRVFQPIRQLVAAADRIARGDLETRVALDRNDVIGTLARSFNEMVKRVRAQQEALGRANRELAHANARLAEANFKLSEANRDLEEKVRQRTAQVETTARQLAAANRRLSGEISEKEDFLRAVSHDLNAPLRNIAGMAAMLLMKYRQVFDEDVVRRLERIQKNVELETGLIAELLELSRIKTRRQNLEVVDLNAMLAELRELFAQDLESRRIALRIDCPLPALHCERARLRQVFQNLIDNAIKYMGGEEGSGLRVREEDSGFRVGEGSGFRVRGSGNTRQGDAPGEPTVASPAAPGSGGAAPSSVPSSSSLNPEPSYLNPSPREIHIGCTVSAEEAEFYVRDTGIGIEPEDLDKVFHVFRRGRSAAVQGVAGKGVGLASVKSVIETYSGTIWVESQPGDGSVFRFTINGKYLPAAGAGGAPGSRDASHTTTSPLTIAPMTGMSAQDETDVTEADFTTGGDPTSTAA